MTRGNQRDLARAKNDKKNQKSTVAGDTEANKGLTFEERKIRDAERMREKQKAALDKQAADTAAGAKK